MKTFSSLRYVTSQSFSRRISSMQKSIVGHQFNLMKDKHTINLILISSKWVIPSFRVCSWWINSSSKCFHLFFSGVQISSAISSEPPSKSSQALIFSFHPSLYLVILLFTGVLHGGSSWFNSFFKSSSRFCWKSSSIFLFLLPEVLILSILLEVLCCSPRQVSSHLVKLRSLFLPFSAGVLPKSFQYYSFLILF